MQAQLKHETIDPDPCITAPDSKYRGAENQLYRVEIHSVSKDKDGNLQSWNFKWSRENGSIVAAWLGTNEDGGLIVSSTRGFEAGGWVEITSDINELYNTPGRLTKIVKVEGDALYLEQGPDTEWDKEILVKFRQWDQRDVDDVKPDPGAVPGPKDDKTWIDLEDGIQVCFELSLGQDFRSGDYWLIPARVATGQIEWPQPDPINKDKEIPRALKPHGIQHHYAPLARIKWDGGSFSLIEECRHPFDPLPTHG